MDWTSDVTDMFYPNNAMITNAATGVVVTWSVDGDQYMAITNGTSVTVIPGPTIPNQDNPPVEPALQASGSFIGTVWDNNGVEYMVAFGQDGGVRWTVPWDWPQVATDDGGIIGWSGTIYDQNGNATGQNEAFTVRSWRGDTYQYDDSLDQIVGSPYSPALSLWAFAGANASGNSTAARPWYFKLVWQNNCSSSPAPCGFTLYPDNPSALESLAVDVSVKSGVIKSAALNALKKAFEKYPVEVSHGSPNTGDHRANVVDGELFNNNGVNCGSTRAFPPTSDSNVYYRASMEQAQWALPIIMRTAQDVNSALGRPDLFNAIGVGIGNTAAHEIGHQFFVASYGMDDTSVNTYNGQGCDGLKSPWEYGFGNIQWEDITARAWSNSLGKGWHR